MVTVNEILLSWNEHGSIKGVVKDLGCTQQKVMKTLASERIIINDTHEKILDYHNQNMNAEQIAELMQMNVKTVKAYLPRVRPVYNEDVSDNAMRIKKCRERAKSPT